MKRSFFLAPWLLAGWGWAGPVGPPSGISLQQQDVILNQPNQQSGKTFNVSSATVSNLRTSTVTVGSVSGVLKATAGVISGGATTSNLPEGSNLYYTVARATSAISATSPLENNNGVLSLSSISVPPGSPFYIQNSTSQVASFVVSTGTANKFTTSDLTVGTLNGVLKATSGSVGVGATTSDVPEGSRQYFTTARSTSSFSATAPLTNTNGTLAMPAATNSQNGYLTSGDWVSFNSKEPAISSGSTSQYWRGDKTFHDLNTSAVTEGSNQYFTTARATSAITAVDPIVNTNGVLTLTSNLPAGATSYIRNASSLQSGAVFNVSSASVNGQLSVSSIKWPNGAVQTSSSTAAAGGSSGDYGALQLSDGAGTFTSASALLWDGSYLDLPRIHFGDPAETKTNTPQILRNGTSLDFLNAYNAGSRFWFKTTSGDGLNISDLGETQLSVGLGGAIPDASAKLELDSTDMGFLPPRMTGAERDAISSPAAGLQVFNTTSNKLSLYNGSTWGDIDAVSISTNTPGASAFIWNSNSLQSGTTFYVASGTVSGTLSAGSFAGSGASLTSLPASSLTGTVANARLDASSVTLQGNSFNAASALVQLDGSANYPALNGSAITSLSASNLGSGTVPDARLDSSSVTLQGNTLNSASSLVQLDASAHYPALNGSAITSLNASNLASGTVPGAQLDASTVTLRGNTFNTASSLVQLDGSAHYPALNGSAVTSLNASNLASGTVPNGRIDASSVTFQGNTFNAASNLVQLDGSANYPALNGSAITSLSASNLASGTVPNGRIDASSVTLQGNTFNAASSLVQLDASAHYPALNGSAVTNLSAANLSGTAPAGVLSNAILNQSSVQSSAVYSVSSGTVSGQLSVGTIRFPDGTIQVSSAPSSGGTSSISTNTTGASGFIWNVNTLQSGATFYVSSGSVSGQLSANTIKFPDGTIQVSSPSISSNIKAQSINYVISGGGLAITTGSKGFLVMEYTCTISSWTIVADQSGSIVVDVKRSTYSGFPSTTSIVGGSGNKPTLSSAQKNTAPPAVWTSTAITAQDILEFNVDSATTVQRVTVGMECDKP